MAVTDDALLTVESPEESATDVALQEEFAPPPRRR